MYVSVEDEKGVFVGFCFLFYEDDWEMCLQLLYHKAWWL